MNAESSTGQADPSVKPQRVDAAARLNWRKLFLSPNGRIGRKSYWIGIAVFFAVVLIADTLDQAFFRAVDGEDGQLIRVLTIAAIYPAICFQTKRLHDLGRTGWLQTGPMAILALTGPFGAAGFGDFIVLIVVLAGVVMGALFVWTAFFKGQAAANKYGEIDSGDREITPVVEVFS